MPIALISVYVLTKVTITAAYIHLKSIEMSKRLHPKTIEERIHQILCKEQDPDEENGSSTMHCYSRLPSSKQSPSSTFPNTHFVSYMYSMQKGCTVSSGGSRSNNRSSIEWSPQQQHKNPYVNSSM